MLETLRGKAYNEVRRDFAWCLPAHFNIGVACSDRHAADGEALIHTRTDGRVDRYTFGDLSRLSNALANTMRAVGVTKGDRVAVVLAQSPRTAVAHLAIHKLGAVAVPLSSLFGPDALLVRLADSGARLVLADQEVLSRIEECTDSLPELERFLLTEGTASTRPSSTFANAFEKGATSFQPVQTAVDDPAVIIYTSGTTGGPKGALHGHRVLLGHLPGFELSHSFFPQPLDLFWTPADWAWIGGLMDALFPALYHGRPTLVVESAGPFDPERALATMARHHVRNTFLPPTALKLMRQAGVSVPESLRLRTMMSGGESLGDEMLEWARTAFGVTVNEIYGQTECNYVVGNCSELFEVVPGSMGKPYPGHDVAVLADDGSPADCGAAGEIAVRTPDPVAFLGYWNKPEETQAKFSGDWLLTGDHGRVDDRGYFHYLGRGDDLINSAGYRIGPTEIESCLMKHPAVAAAAVVGVPDPLRGEVIKACVVPREGMVASDQLAGEIQAFVKSRLAAYQYPRIVEFVDEMPLTTTGKIRRLELRQPSARYGPAEIIGDGQ